MLFIVRDSLWRRNLVGFCGFRIFSIMVLSCCVLIDFSFINVFIIVVSVVVI